MIIGELDPSLLHTADRGGQLLGSEGVGEDSRRGGKGLSYAGYLQNHKTISYQNQRH